MVGTVVTGDTNVNQREARKNAIFGGLLSTSTNRRDILFRNDTTLDCINVFEATARLKWLKTQPTVAVLTTTARLTDNLALHFNGLRDRLAICNLRCADVSLDFKLTLHTVDDDLQMQLTHAGDDDLTGLFIRLDAQRRVFLNQLTECSTHLFLVTLGLRLDGDMNNGLRKLH